MKLLKIKIFWNNLVPKRKENTIFDQKIRLFFNLKSDESPIFICTSQNYFFSYKMLIFYK